MLAITANKISPTTVLLDAEQFNSLVQQARKVDEVLVKEIVDDVPIEALMKLQEQSGALDFLNAQEENIYSVHDVKVKYK